MCYHHHNIFLAPLASNTSLGTQNTEQARVTAGIYLKEQWITIKVLSIKKNTVPEEPLLKAETKAKSRQEMNKKKKKKIKKSPQAII